MVTFMQNLQSFFLAAMLALGFSTSVLAQDWADLHRFKAENSGLGLPRPGEQRVVFMGNSITEGWSDHMPEFFEGKPFINRGISGQTTPQMLLRFRQDVIGLKPAVVVILAGTNDIAGNTGPATSLEIFGNICSMAELAKMHGIQVVLSSILPTFDYPWKPGLEPAHKIIEINQMLKEYALQNGHIYLDYHSAMADGRNGLKGELTYDGVHPNRTGYLLMAQLALPAIGKALGE